MAAEARISPEWLSGKRIVVTGAASGIGMGAARLFKELGAEIVVADRDLAALVRAWPDLPTARRQLVDVVDEVACELLMASANTLLGGVDGVFNSAGVSDVVAPAMQVGIDDWQRVIDVNLRGTFLICRAAGRVMLPQGSGSVVTVSSVNGVTGIPRRHAYGPAKAAIAQLTRTLACEWASAGVRVNALAPTYIRTPMIDRLEAEGKIDVGRLERRIPMGRLGEVEEVGSAAAFLLSDWSRFLTGVLLPVDGGWLAYGGPGDVETA
jgi:NAD(P)-dependent dehydrogenase (short-subunit alcohol dehydrogenase family)